MIGSQQPAYRPVYRRAWGADHALGLDISRKGWKGWASILCKSILGGDHDTDGGSKGARLGLVSVAFTGCAASAVEHGVSNRTPGNIFGHPTLQQRTEQTGPGGFVHRQDKHHHHALELACKPVEYSLVGPHILMQARHSC
jgi:hypothetical protein